MRSKAKFESFKYCEYSKRITPPLLLLFESKSILRFRRVDGEIAGNVSMVVVVVALGIERISTSHVVGLYSTRQNRKTSNERK